MLQKYPGNKTLIAFGEFYRKHNVRPEVTYNTLLILLQENIERVGSKKLKKLTIGDICGIGASLRMYAYLSTVTPGVEGSLYKSQGYRDAQRLLLTYESYLNIVDAFETLRRDYQQDEARYGVDGTADKVLNTAAKNCETDPITFADNLPALMVNEVVDFSQTEATYKADY